jgi:hypothetical protein
MKTKIDNGQITFSFEQAHIAQNDTVSPHLKGLRLQFYWPIIKWENTKRDERYSYSRNTKHLYVAFKTVFRIIKQDDYIGFGITVLGFGAAFDYQF